MNKVMSFQRKLESRINNFIDSGSALRLSGMTFVVAVLVNLVAVFGPERGFDALWYHLTLPKIWHMWGKIDFVPGGLLYYSAMPRLGEFIYYLFNANDVAAHFVQFLAGVGAAVFTYKIAKIYLDKKYSLLAAIIFYCNPLVGWQSGSAYVDLIRTFFESAALYFLLSKKYIFSGVAVGLAVGVKTLALGSLGILGVLGGIRVIGVALLISLPWFIWAYLKTGYLFYPIGAGILDSTHNIGNIWPLIPLEWWMISYYATILWWPRKSLVFKYALLGFLVWFMTPRTGETRFLLPYLPAFAVLAAQAVEKKKILIFLVIGVALVSIIYRGVANARLIPYLIGKETKTEFLCKNLDFKTQVFVDCDGWYAKNIKSTDLVLIKGYHNLYYVDFPFVHESWYKGESVTRIISR